MKIFLIAMLLPCLLLSAGCGSDKEDDKWAVYNLGDAGPAGGVIFYINPTAAADGWKYLECAPPEAELVQKSWGGRNYAVAGADGLAIATGKQNSLDIVLFFGNAEPHNGKTDYAAKVCYYLEHNGYSDWYLPSKEELNLMHQNLRLQNLATFAEVGYWSSSENSPASAWGQLFNSAGTQYQYFKDGEYRVRAIRAF